MRERQQPLEQDVRPASRAVTIVVCRTCRDEAVRRTAPDPRRAARRSRRSGGAAPASRSPGDCLGNCKRRLSAAMVRPAAGAMCSAISRAAAAPIWSPARGCSPPRPTGCMPWRGRPEALKRGLVARIPPIDMRRKATTAMTALSAGALHRRHRLSRRRQDDADPPRAGERRRQAAGDHRQRVRRHRHRRRDPEGLRHRDLPGGEHRRARQWLHLLHRGRRFRAGARPDPGAGRRGSITS